MLWTVEHSYPIIFLERIATPDFSFIFYLLTTSKSTQVANDSSMLFMSILLSWLMN